MEGTEPPDEAPKSTETGVVPQTDLGSDGGDDELREEALELLRLTAMKEPIELERAITFARRVLAMSKVGRLALEVMDGGAGAGRALVRLAELQISSDRATFGKNVGTTRGEG